MEVADSDHSQPAGFIRRYVFSTDHKVIAKQYLLLSLTMALIGGLHVVPDSMAARVAGDLHPRMGPDRPRQYNAIITMHGTIMVFFVAMPLLLGAFGNYLIPLMVGADDMAFPRLNMMSFWTLFAASVVLMISMFVPGGPAAAGWTSYAPLSDNPIYTGVTWGQNLWILAVALEFASFLMGGMNFLTTALNMRAPGMTLMRLPMLVWMEITAAVVFLLSVGPLIGGALMLLLDRRLGTGFFRARQGRRSVAVGASVLVLRPSRGLRGRVTGLRHHARGNAGVLAQANFRLQDDDLVDNRAPDCSASWCGRIICSSAGWIRGWRRPSASRPS